MNRQTRVLMLLGITVIISLQPVLAQSEKPELVTDSATNNASQEKSPAGQEVEITEDNYRQFMELRDPNRLRNMLPEDAFKPQSGLQKLDKLPEDSQKHLRNQLREIIVQGDQWQPGDEGTDYPYVPSQAAMTDQALKNQEAEAWGELLDSYHKREAQIYENSARTRAAMASDGDSADGTGGGTGGGQGSPGNGTGQTGMGEQAGDENPTNSENASAGGYTPGQSSDSGANSTAGVSQNAMEFLSKTGKQGAQSDQGSPGNPQAESPPGENSQAQAGEAANADGADGQGESEEDGEIPEVKEPATMESSADQTAQIPARETETDSTKGASQNALEYLKGTEKQKTAEQTVIINMSNTTDALSIEELSNARGVGGPAVTEPPPRPVPEDEQETGKLPPDKDGNGP